MLPSSKAIVLDASAVLAVLLHEPGDQVLRGLEHTALVSAVNLTEVRSRLWDKGHSEKTIDEMLIGINMLIVAFDAEQGKLAADLRPQTRPLGLSLGDRACLALAIVKDAIVYTADRAWSKLDLPIDIIHVR